MGLRSVAPVHRDATAAVTKRLLLTQDKALVVCHCRVGSDKERAFT